MASISDDWQEVDHTGTVRPATPLFDTPHQAGSALDTPEQFCRSTNTTDAGLGASPAVTSLSMDSVPAFTSAISLHPQSQAWLQGSNSADDILSGDGNNDGQGHILSTDMVALGRLTFGNTNMSPMLDLMHQVQLKLRASSRSQGSTSSTALTVIQKLEDQVISLTRIMDERPRSGTNQSSRTSTGNLPLTDHIFDWTSTVFNTMKEAESLLSVPLIENQSADIVRLVQTLDEYQCGMAEFLPIFQADFDEYRTHSMSLSVHGGEMTTKCTSGPREPPNPHMVRIRVYLYRLKDHLESIVLMLQQHALHYQQCSSCLFSPPPLLLTSSDRCGAMSKLLVTILTNNESEWIDSDIYYNTTGMLTHEDFATLDPDILHDIGECLAGLSSALHVTECRERVREEDTVAFEFAKVDKLKELLSVLEFLEIIFMPGKSREHVLP